MGAACIPGLQVSKDPNDHCLSVLLNTIKSKFGLNKPSSMETSRNQVQKITSQYSLVYHAIKLTEVFEIFDSTVIISCHATLLHAKLCLHLLIPSEQQWLSGFSGCLEKTCYSLYVSQKAQGCDQILDMLVACLCCESICTASM